MANNCLVTKLKGTVDNQNLRYFGEINFYPNSSSTSSVRNVSIITSDTVNYKMTGVTSSMPLEGQLPANTYCNISFDEITSNDANIKIWSKYKFKTLSLNVGVFVKAEETKGLNIPIGIQGPQLWDKLDHSVTICKFETYNMCIPLIFNDDYSNLHVDMNNIPDSILFHYDTNTSNAYNYKGDLGYVLDWINTVGIADRITTFDIWETGATPFNIEKMAILTNVSIFTLHDTPFYGDIYSTIKDLKKISTLVLFSSASENFNYTSTFDYWAANGKNGNVLCWCNGDITINGTTRRIAGGETFSFSNGTWHSLS